MRFDKIFIEEISQFKTIYCLISGGWHSTASALILWKSGFKNVILVHNKTFLEMKESKETMELVKQITRYKYVETVPKLPEGKSVWDIMKESFQKVPEVQEDIKNGYYDRTKLKCCTIFKKSNNTMFYKEDNCIIIDSICPYESTIRRAKLSEIRKKDTFIRNLKSRKFFKAYPFRDILTEKQFLPFLNFIKTYIPNIKHSGCFICPLVIVWRNYKSPQYYASQKAMIRAGMPCFQKTLEFFIKNE